MTEPKTVRIRATDVRPYRWALWCSVDGGEPFANPIEGRRWSEDGQHIWFMLDTHNFYKAAPDDEIELIPVVPSFSAELLADIEADDARRFGSRPTSVATSPYGAAPLSCGGSAQ
jgi:hypothetical protein